MTREISAATAFLVLCSATSTLANDIELDWTSVELGFVQETNEAGATRDGLAVYVPANRIVAEDDFTSIIPEFCDTFLDGVLSYATRIEGAPDVSFLMLQVEFYGPKIGENQSYIAGTETVDLDNGKCVP